MALSKFDLEELRQAKRLLEHPGIAARLTALAGAPVEKGMKLLPSRFQKAVHAATEKALTKALDIAVGSLGTTPRTTPSNRLHTMAVATSGAIGGAFGIAALGVELPISTTLILRSIADIAAAEARIPARSRPS